MLGLPPRVLGWTVAAGLAIGITYALSPLTVWFLVAMAVLVPLSVKGIAGDERRWILTMLVAAIVLRVVAIGGLFLLTNHAQVPFGSFFGDEEYFIKRSIWLRNVALGIPIHGADLIYAFSEYSATSYLYVLAFIQVLVGPAPYGVHLLGMALYLWATVVLFRTVRLSLGRMPALIGLGLLLFLPSLFAWSISALKEPLFFLLTAASVGCAVKLVRGPGVAARAVGLLALVAIAVALETIRPAGAALCVVSVAGGLMVAMVVARPHPLIAVFIAVPIIAGAVLSRPAVQFKAYTAMQNAARSHWGHVATAGYVYKVLDERLYPDRSEISDLRFGETARFLVRAVVRYVTVPLPWEAQSVAALAFLPEQILWYVLLAFVPFGVVFAFRRDVVVAGLLVAHAAIAGLSVALTSGNVGTLIRHRGLALPYLVWLGAVGACELLSRSSLERRRASSSPPEAAVLRIEPTCP
jgi:hypothetical protein